MKIKTNQLTGAALDWAVAKCESTPVARHSTGAIYFIDTPWADKSRVKWLAEFSPSKHWAQGGPIIERELIGTGPRPEGSVWPEPWLAASIADDAMFWGAAPLIAAMRCYVTSKLGDEVEVPEELV